jgi:hypothetical protein
MATPTLLFGWTFAGLFLGKGCGWVLGVILYGLLLLPCSAGFVIALSGGAKDDAASFADSSTALFGFLIMGLIGGTPLYLLLRCRKRYFRLTAPEPPTSG